MKGWVCLYRSIWAWRYSPDITGESFSKMEAWLSLICDANHADRKVGEVMVNRGQMLTSQVKLAERWKWSRGKVRRFLDCLESGSEIVQQTVQQAYTLITLINYPIYQGNDTADDTANGTPNGTADGQPTVHKQQCKNGNNDNKKSYVGTEAYRLAVLLHSLILTNNPKAKKPNLEKWAESVDRMIRIDKRDSQEVEVLTRWCQADDFWCTNILSADKLRKQYDQLTMHMGRGQKREKVISGPPAYTYGLTDATCFKCGKDDICEKPFGEWLCRTCYEEAG